jgi:hypothetical protein
MSNNKQSSIDKEFVPYAEALALKELGFNEPCFGVYFNPTQKLFIGKTINKHTRDVRTLAPTYSQAFRWFRENCNLHHSIEFDKTQYFGRVNDWTSNIFETYEEAEVTCLKKLIEIETNCLWANIFIHCTFLSLLEKKVKGNKKLFRGESTPEQDEEVRKEIKNLKDRLNKAEFGGGEQ